MAKAYDYDLRVRAIKLIDSGLPITDVHVLLNISRDTLYAWIKLKAKSGDLISRKPGGKGSGDKVKDLAKFKEFVQSNADKTQTELAKLWPIPIAQTTIGRYLRKIGFTLKKRPMATVSETK